MKAESDNNATLNIAALVCFFWCLTPVALSDPNAAAQGIPGDNSRDLNSRRTMRVELIGPTTGGSLKIVDQNRRTIRAKVALEESYSPKEVMAAK